MMGITYFSQASTVVMIILLLWWGLLTKSYGEVSWVKASAARVENTWHMRLSTALPCAVWPHRFRPG